MNTTRGNHSFHVGDRVKIGMGQYTLTGEVVEDRGAIGARGRRLYQVRVPMDPFDPMTMELSEDEMEAAPPATETAASIDKQRIADYLANGGLISILRSNMAGGKNQPRAWLCLDQLGNITHTFVPERGVVGGQIVPFGAVRDGAIFPPKRAAVTSFVESFGLTRRDAERVVSLVGATP